MDFEPRCDLFRSPQDNRDWIAEQIYLRAIPIPETFDWRDELCVLPIRSQGTSSQCAAFSGAAIKETQELKESRMNGYGFHNNFSTNTYKCYFSPQFDEDNLWYLGSPLDNKIISDIERKTNKVVLDDYFYIAVGIVSVITVTFFGGE